MSHQPKRYVRLQYFRGEDRQWYVRLRYGNGGVAMTSEGYVSESKAIRAAVSMRSAMYVAAITPRVAIEIQKVER